MPDVPQADRLKLFISYSRRDRAAADALVAALEGAGFEVTIDRRDLPYGEEWQRELADFIRASDTVVWLVSPDSVQSKWCNWELGEVGRLHKRMLPVRIREVAPEDLPQGLGKIQLLPAEGLYDPAVHLSPLVAALEADRAWVKEASRLADRAREWVDRHRDGGLLLRGVALKNAEAWSTRQPRSAPRPAAEVLTLILESRRAAVRRQRLVVAGACTVAVVASGLAGIALFQRNRAERELRTSTAERLAAEAQAALVESRQDAHPGAPDAQRGVLLALESSGVQSNLQAERVLREGLRQLPGASVAVKLEAGDELRELGPDAAWIAIVRDDSDVIFDTASRTFRPPSDGEASWLKGAPLSHIEVDEMAEGTVAESRDGRFAVVRSDEGLQGWVFASLALARVADGRTLAVLPLDAEVRQAVFRQDGGHLLTVTGRLSMDAEEPSATRLVGSTVNVWAVPSGEKVTEITFAHLGGITHVAVDPEQDWLAVQTSDADGDMVIVMPIWPDVARREACRRLSRNLSPSEWATFVGREPRSETCPGLPTSSE